MLGVQALGDKGSVGREHIAAEFREDRNVVHALGGEDFLILLTNQLAYLHDIAARLLGAIIDSDTAGKIDKSDMHAASLAESYGELEEYRRELRVIVVRHGVGRKERVDAEVLCAVGLESGEGLGHLFFAHAVLSLAGVVHDLHACT